MLIVAHIYTNALVINCSAATCREARLIVRSSLTVIPFPYLFLLFSFSCTYRGFVQKFVYINLGKMSLSSVVSHLSSALFGSLLSKMLTIISDPKITPNTLMTRRTATCCPRALISRSCFLSPIPVNSRSMRYAAQLRFALPRMLF